MNVFAVGFVGVAAVVGLGVDYHQQSLKAELPLGQMGIGQYVETYEARFLGARAEARAQERESERQAAWKKGGIQYLPEPPEGWTRRAYSEGVNAAIMYEDTVFYEEMAKHGGAKSMAETLRARKAGQAAAETDKHAHVYERGNETVFISLNTRTKVNENAFGSMIGLSMSGLNASDPDAVLGYQVVGGVGIVELPANDTMMAQLAAADRGGFERMHFRRLRGHVGFNEEVVVTVHANASTAATLEILEAVDWDGINAMLSDPVASVGNDVTLPEGLDPAAVAKDQFTLRSRYNELRAKAAHFKLRNLNEAAFMMNVLSEGAVDVTGGDVPDLSTLIEAAFRKERGDLMAGRPPGNDYDRIVSMMEERPVEERDTPRGEMTEALKRELDAAQGARGNAPTPTRRADAFKPERIALDATTRAALDQRPDAARARIAVAVAAMEKKKGYAPGTCFLIDASKEIHCFPGTKAGSGQKQAAAEPSATPEKTSGLMDKIGGFFAAAAKSAGATKPERGEAQVISRGGSKAGIGATAGKCSYEGAIKRCTIGN